MILNHVRLYKQVSDDLRWSELRGDLNWGDPRYLRLSQVICRWSHLRWCQVISSDLRISMRWSVMISGDQVIWSQVISLPSILNCTAKICGYFRWFQKIWGDLRWCQVMSGSIIKYQMIWRDLSWTEVILGDLWWSQLISGDLRQHRVIPGDLKLSQVLWVELRRSEVIFFDIRRSEVISGKLRWS